MRTRFIAVLLALGITATPSAAQMWDSPTFFSPRPGEDIGLYVVDTNGAADVGVTGIWRQQGNLNLGVRAGIAGDNILLGSEFFGDLNAGRSPLLVAWNLGFGATFGDGYTVVRVPLGASVGIALGTGSVRILPYVHPRLAFDMVTVDGDGDNQEFNLPVDLGADVQLGQMLTLRLGATFGDSDAIGIGVAYRFGRRLVVR